MPEFTTAPTSARVPLSRRRDKPQLSCNLCRRRKLKCDRGAPCATCARRGLSLSCTYASEHTVNAQRVPQPVAIQTASVPNTTTMQDRIGQLEKLVRDLMGNANNGRSEHIPSYAAGPNTAMTPPSDVDDLNGPEEPVPISDTFGLISLEQTSTSYVENNHWSAILDGIAELKEHFVGDIEQANSSRFGETIDHEPDTPALVFSQARKTTLAEILNGLPFKQDSDRLIQQYFDNMEYAPVILHSPTFLKEYAQFWSSPNEVSLMWLSMLFSMFCLSVQLQMLVTLAGVNPPSPQALLESKRLMQHYKEKATQCLILGRYTNCAPHTVEALLQYMYIEYFSRSDSDVGAWAFFAMVVRLAMRSGYHKDGSHYAQISVFRAEMRRRVWAILQQLDIMSSGQIGLPRMISDNMSDCKEPRNLKDEDLSEDMTELPPSRPDTIITRVSMCNAKSKLINLQAIVGEITSSNSPAYAEILSVDKIMTETYRQFPSELLTKPMSESMLDDAGLVMRRYLLELVFQKLQITLHRKYLFIARTNDRFAHSRQVCIDAAITSLATQEILEREACTGGRMYKERWKLTSPLIRGEFLLATTILCLDVYHDLKLAASPNQQYTADSVTNQREIAALSTSLTIWDIYKDTSDEARKAAAAIRIVLAKAGEDVASPTSDAPKDTHAPPILLANTAMYRVAAQRVYGVPDYSQFDFNNDFDTDSMMFFEDQGLDSMLNMPFDPSVLGDLSDVQFQPIHGFGSR